MAASASAEEARLQGVDFQVFGRALLLQMGVSPKELDAAYHHASQVALRVADLYKKLRRQGKSPEEAQRLAIVQDTQRVQKGCANPSCTGLFATVRKMKRCSGCQEVFYCDQKCQRTHWLEHKKVCQIHSKSRSSKKRGTD